MKGLGIFIAAVVLGFLGYQVAYPRIFDSAFSASTPSLSKEPAAVPTMPKAPADLAALKTDPSKVPETLPQVPPKATPPIPAAGGMGASVAANPNDPNAFQPPVFPTLEDITKNWTVIPKKTFPRTVTLYKPLEFVLSIGKSKVKSGGTVVALEQKGGNLIVAPTENSPARSQIPMDDTDIKESLMRSYETWKVDMTEYKRQQWTQARTAPQKPKEATSNTVANNDKPTRNPDGTYPLLLASMKAGQVTDITPTNIKKWGEAKQEKIDGKACWVVVVEVTIPTMIGPFDTTAEAHIFNGKVEKWVYTKSREVVP